MLELLTLKQLDPQHCVEVPQLLQQVRRSNGQVNVLQIQCLCRDSRPVRSAEYGGSLLVLLLATRALRTVCIWGMGGKGAAD